MFFVALVQPCCAAVRCAGGGGGGGAGSVRDTTLSDLNMSCCMLFIRRDEGADGTHKAAQRVGASRRERAGGGVKMEMAAAAGPGFTFRKRGQGGGGGGAEGHAGCENGDAAAVETHVARATSRAPSSCFIFSRRWTSACSSVRGGNRGHALLQRTRVGRGCSRRAGGCVRRRASAGQDKS